MEKCEAATYDLRPSSFSINDVEKVGQDHVPTVSNSEIIGFESR